MKKKRKFKQASLPYLENQQSELQDHSAIRVFFDGSIDQNPGGCMGWGFHASQHGKEICRQSFHSGRGKTHTNNVAEYLGLIAALEWLYKNNLHKEKIIITGDSTMVIRQMQKGAISPKSQGHYASHARRAILLSKSFEAIKFCWVRREYNQVADELSKYHRK